MLERELPDYLKEALGELGTEEPKEIHPQKEQDKEDHKPDRNSTNGAEQID